MTYIMNPLVDPIIAGIIILMIFLVSLLFAHLYSRELSTTARLRKDLIEMENTLDATMAARDSHYSRLLQLEETKRSLASMNAKLAEELRRPRSDQETAKQLTSVFDDFKGLIMRGRNITIDWAEWFAHGQLPSMDYWVKNAPEAGPLRAAIMAYHFGAAPQSETAPCDHLQVETMAIGQRVCTKCGIQMEYSEALAVYVPKGEDLA